MSGPASGVYLFLWNRSDAAQAGVTVTGDPGFLERGNPASASAGADQEGVMRPEDADNPCRRIVIPPFSVKYMFDLLEPGTAPGSVCDDPTSGTAGAPGGADLRAGRAPAAATCRFLVLLADFDARRGWASWEMNSCAAWLSWKCQMSSRTAREHVRVARALRDLPVIRAEFAAARLSYAKVRALTRIATPDTEAGLAEIAGPMTGNQLERFARAHRQVSLRR